MVSVSVSIARSAEAIASGVAFSAMDNPTEPNVGLQGGILSNTLGFAAPSTHQRDHVIFEWLRQVRPLDPRLVAAMRLARDEALLRTTAESVAADVKLMIVNGERIALSQIEAARAGAIADRDDFWPAIEKMRQHHRADHVLVNLVDLELGRSRLAVSTGWVRSLLSERYGLVFDSDTVWAEEIFLRKTHLVPLLMGG